MRTIHTSGSCFIPAHVRAASLLRARVFLSLAGALGLLGGAFAASAAEPGAGKQEYAHQLAVGVCGTCHGPHGNSVQPKFPRLAGQDPNYLAAQLKSFRGQTRGDPDAIGYMWGMAAQLDDATIEALASYYASQRAEPSSSRDSAQVTAGKEIYEHGVQSEGVPACASCHGPDAHGIADFPRLAGQHAQYVLKQLGSFQSNMRNVAVMHGVALNLRMAEMESVAAYLETQP
jgi:cytochrome c553